MLGLKIITSRYLVDQITDFSRCRSPSRAARRLKRGIRGQVKVSEVPKKEAYKMPDGTLVIHPDVYDELLRKYETPRSSLGYRFPE